MFGAIRGSRFWPLDRVRRLWSDLLDPVLRAAVGDGATNPEALGDWEACLDAATNKVDPNRIRWLFAILTERDSLLGTAGNVGAFKESSFLRLLNKTIAHNFKVKKTTRYTFLVYQDHCVTSTQVRELYVRTYEGIIPHISHRYISIRNLKWSLCTILISRLCIFFFSYDKVRVEISKVLSTLLSFDLPQKTKDGKIWNMGNGFPR